MNQQLTKAIVLRRTNYGEADRVLTLLTRDHGKLAAMARGVRKERSKLAGGVELFSISEIGFLRGRGELATLTTSRLVKYYDNIVNDIDKTMLGYQLLKLIDKVTEDDAETEYFNALEQALSGLDNKTLGVELVQLWFNLRLLSISGHSPNLRTDSSDQPLQADHKYNFDYVDMVFTKHDSAGTYQTGHLKVLRLLTQATTLQKLGKIQGIDSYLSALLQLSEQMRKYHLHS